MASRRSTSGVSAWRRAPVGGGLGRLLTAVVAVAALVVLGVPAASAAPGGPGSTPAAAGLTVTPASGLLNDQVVTVTGSGFPAGAQVAVTQCVKVTGGTAQDCNLGRVGYATADGSGAFSVGYTVQRILYVRGTTTDCAVAGACVIGAGVPPDGAQGAASADIQFDPSAPLPPPPSITVTPSTNLLDGQTVTVEGSDFPSGSFVVLVECVDAASGGQSNCDLSNQMGTGADASGSFSVTMRLSRLISTPAQGTTDCAQPSTCIIGAGVPPDGSQGSAKAPIQFDPNAPLPPPPSITVAPSTGLGDGQTVTVSGTGFVPDGPVGIIECGSTGSQNRCDFATLVYGHAGADGTFSQQLRVKQDLDTAEGSFDCTRPEGCILGAASLARQSDGASATIHFGTTAPPPPPPSSRPASRADPPGRGRPWWTRSVRPDEPSLTALGVAAARASLDRPATPSGDPAADQALAGSLLAARAADPRHGDREGYASSGFPDWVSARTAFFDEAVLRAVDAGLPQVVILGAGYDGRALRFRSPGVRFLEVDHPATQDDKRARLAQLGIDASDVAFVAADFTEPGLGEALGRAGHRPDEPSLFVLEGVLRYLPERWFRALLAAVADRTAVGSELAVSISTRPPGDEGAPTVRELERRRRLAEMGEPVLTVPERDVALGWLAEAGWEATSVVDVAEGRPGTGPVGCSSWPVPPRPARGRLRAVAVPVDERERQDLCDLLEELGPDAPTLCEGWTTADLAAHLVLREHFRRWGDERRAAEKAKGLPALVARLRGGAPLVPWRIPGVRTLLNGGEYLIHHEDVRRANGRGPRAERPDLDDVAWRMAGFTGRRLAATGPARRRRAALPGRPPAAVREGRGSGAHRGAGRAGPLSQRPARRRRGRRRGSGGGLPGGGAGPAGALVAAVGWARWFEREPTLHSFVGLTVEQAGERCAEQGFDGPRLFPDPPEPGDTYQLDRRSNRLNLLVRDGVVVDAALF